MTSVLKPVSQQFEDFPCGSPRHRQAGDNSTFARLPAKVGKLNPSDPSDTSRRYLKSATGHKFARDGDALSQWWFALAVKHGGCQ